MKDVSLQQILLKKYLRLYNDACNEKDYGKAYEIAVDISDLALQLENFAQEMANDTSNA